MAERERYFLRMLKPGSGPIYRVIGQHGDGARTAREQGAITEVDASPHVYPSMRFPGD